MEITSIAQLITEDPDISAEYRDYNKLLKELKAEASRLKLQVIDIGKVDGHSVMLARPPELKDGLNNLLIIGGFHGEEIAAVLGIMEFLKHAPDNLLEHINISVIPTINPYGFINATRYGKDEKPTNQVYDGDNYDPSDNCKILIEIEDQIKELSRDGLLDLHENTDINDYFYVYAYASKEHSSSNDLVDIARQTAMRHFKQRKDGHYKDTNPGKAEYDIEDGVVWNSHDGSFDDYINAFPLLILETPAKSNANLNKRIAAHRDFIESIFANLSIDQSDTPIFIIPTAHQTTNCSCGGACLRAIMRYYNIDIPEHRVNDLADISKEGIDPDMISATAAKFGLKSKIYKNWKTHGIKKFIDDGVPVIVGIVAWGNDDKDYTKDEDGHYVVVIGYDKCRIYFEDPSIKDGDNSKGYLSWREFIFRWHDADGKRIGIPIFNDSNKAKTINKSKEKFIRIP